MTIDRSFRLHLVLHLAAQLAVLVVARAAGAVDEWAWLLLLAGTLTFSGHAAARTGDR